MKQIAIVYKERRSYNQEQLYLEGSQLQQAMGSAEVAVTDTPKWRSVI